MFNVILPLSLSSSIEAPVIDIHAGDVISHGTNLLKEIQRIDGKPNNDGEVSGIHGDINRIDGDISRIRSEISDIKSELKRKKNK